MILLLRHFPYGRQLLEAVIADTRDMGGHEGVLLEGAIIFACSAYQGLV